MVKNISKKRNLIYIDKLPQNAKPIKNSFDYVDKKGNVYGFFDSHWFVKRLSCAHGYKYCGIRYKDGRYISKRIHRLVAETFIPNPNNLPIVMHKDNNKANNNVTNLKWGTISENTQQAADDKLFINKKGFEDSQSIPCKCYSTLTNDFIKEFGSVSIAEKETGIEKAAILYQIKKRPVLLKKEIYFTKYDEPPIPHEIIIQYDFETNNEIKRCQTIGEMSRQTGIRATVINTQVVNNRKPNWSKSNTYFMRKTIK